MVLFSWNNAQKNIGDVAAIALKYSFVMQLSHDCVCPDSQLKHMINVSDFLLCSVQTDSLES